MRQIMLKFGRGMTRLFRINAGVGWIGVLVSKSKDGTVILRNARPFHGAPAGASDLLGWHSIEVTQAMVGKRLAVLVACETKTGRRKPTPEQAAFLHAVETAGGIAVCARSEADVEQALAGAGGRHGAAADGALGIGTGDHGPELRRTA